jgi:hypothetical protein
MMAFWLKLELKRFSIRYRDSIAAAVLTANHADAIKQILIQAATG